MPILLPVLVRRSVRETTVAATRPALAPDFTERENSVHDCTLSFCSSVEYSSSGWPDRKNPMASYSRCSLSAASQGSTAGTVMVSRLAAPPNMSFCPTVTASWVRCAVDIMASTAA